MTASYDPSLPTDLDWVRYLTGDKDTSAALLSDEEIIGTLNEELVAGCTKPIALKYFAAARSLQTLYTQWTSSGKGISDIQIGRLHIKQGTDSSTDVAIEDRIKELRSRGAYLLSPSPHAFKTLGSGRFRREVHVDTD